MWCSIASFMALCNFASKENLGLSSKSDLPHLSKGNKKEPPSRRRVRIHGRKRISPAFGQSHALFTLSKNNHRGAGLFRWYAMNQTCWLTYHYPYADRPKLGLIFNSSDSFRSIVL
jgi:hypothetical protein